MKQNTIRLYKHYSEMAENPIGNDAQERESVKRKALNSKKNLEEHFKKGKKYKNDPEIKKLLGIKEEPKDEDEVVTNAKKSK